MEISRMKNINPPQKNFQIPEGYFEHQRENLIQEFSTKPSSFQVPLGYFENQQQNLIEANTNRISPYLIFIKNNSYKIAAVWVVVFSVGLWYFLQPKTLQKSDFSQVENSLLELYVLEDEDSYPLEESPDIIEQYSTDMEDVYLKNAENENNLVVHATSDNSPANSSQKNTPQSVSYDKVSEVLYDIYINDSIQISESESDDFQL